MGTFLQLELERPVLPVFLQMDQSFLTHCWRVLTWHSLVLKRFSNVSHLGPLHQSTISWWEIVINQLIDTLTSVETNLQSFPSRPLWHQMDPTIAKQAKGEKQKSATATSCLSWVSTWHGARRRSVCLVRDQIFFTVIVNVFNGNYSTPLQNKFLQQWKDRSFLQLKLSQSIEQIQNCIMW